MMLDSQTMSYRLSQNILIFHMRWVFPCRTSLSPSWWTSTGAPSSFVHALCPLGARLPQPRGSWATAKQQRLHWPKRCLQPELSTEWIERYYALVEREDRELYIQGLRKAGLK